jgi:dihydroxyacetone kinase-like protein
MIDSSHLRAALLAIADAVSAHAEELTALDAAIGDGDHGANMKRGFDAVAADIDTICAKPLAEALKAVGTKLVMTIGGASGPLYGTLFLTLGKELAVNPEAYVVADVLAVARAAVAGTKDRKAIRGRASFLGDRSIGHIDPGARSSLVLIEASAGVVP